MWYVLCKHIIWICAEKVWERTIYMYSNNIVQLCTLTGCAALFSDSSIVFSVHIIMDRGHLDVAAPVHISLLQRPQWSVYCDVRQRKKITQCNIWSWNDKIYSWEVTLCALFSILPLWPIFMNENGGWDFTVIPSIIAVSPSPLPWFVYSNLLQNVSRPFINPTHLTWHGYFMHVIHADIRTSGRVVSYALSSTYLARACHGLKQYTKHMYWKHYLVQTNKLTG